MSDSNPSISMVQSTNWKGSIPVVVTLAPSSLSSHTSPAAMHCLVSRHSYLHVDLQHIVFRLYDFAPPQISYSSMIRREEPHASKSEEDEAQQDSASSVESQSKELSTKTKPICWFEDEETQTPLRWHLFSGVLYDLLRPTCLPWKIRLHFTAYPQSLLPLHDPQQIFKNSLKQALTLQYGHSKVALNLTKESHDKLWQSIQSQNYHLYREVEFPMQPSPNIIPIRLMINARPPLQRPCRQDCALKELLPENVKRVTVAGITPRLDSSILELWKALAHPDHFLYIIIITHAQDED